MTRILDHHHHRRSGVVAVVRDRNRARSLRKSDEESLGMVMVRGSVVMKVNGVDTMVTVLERSDFLKVLSGTCVYVFLGLNTNPAI